MSETIMVATVDCGTGENIERPATEEELAIFAELAAASNARKAADEKRREEIAALKASAKAKLIAGQPLTAEEADTLVI